jgi:hypothetical protein
MKNIMKIMLALLTSVSIVSSANAGALTVTGTAKATLNSISGGTNGAANSPGIGITNEIDFGATGELDNGFTWKYQVQLDPDAGATKGTAVMDDTRLEIGTPYGTLGIYNSEGGLDTDNKASQSVYARPTDLGTSSGIADTFSIDAYSNLQLHTPAGLLPYDASVKLGFAPGNNNKVGGANSSGSANDGLGDNAYQLQITGTPVDGLNVGADYYIEEGAGNTHQTVNQQAESGSVFATYAYGAATFGVSRSLKAALIMENNDSGASNGEKIRDYETNKMSVAYNVNDALSISYEEEKSEATYILATTAQNDIKAKAIQAAYTMGGMTLAVSHGSIDNVSYTAANDSTETVVAITMAF